MKCIEICIDNNRKIKIMNSKIQARILKRNFSRSRKRRIEQNHIKIAVESKINDTGAFVTLVCNTFH